MWFIKRIYAKLMGDLVIRKILYQESFEVVSPNNNSTVISYTEIIINLDKYGLTLIINTPNKTTCVSGINPFKALLQVIKIQTIQSAEYEQLKIKYRQQSTLVSDYEWKLIGGENLAKQDFIELYTPDDILSAAKVRGIFIGRYNRFAKLYRDNNGNTLNYKFTHWRPLTPPNKTMQLFEQETSINLTDEDVNMLTIMHQENFSPNERLKQTSERYKKEKENGILKTQIIDNE